MMEKITRVSPVVSIPAAHLKWCGLEQQVVEPPQPPEETEPEPEPEPQKPEPPRVLSGELILYNKAGRVKVHHADLKNEKMKL